MIEINVFQSEIKLSSLLTNIKQEDITGRDTTFSNGLVIIEKFTPVKWLSYITTRYKYRFFIYEGFLLLIWIHFNPSVEKQSHDQ